MLAKNVFGMFAVSLCVLLCATASLFAQHCDKCIYFVSNETDQDIVVKIVLVNGLEGVREIPAGQSGQICIDWPVCHEIDKVIIRGQECSAETSCDIGDVCVLVTLNEVYLFDGPCP